jgi:hypothetical protein
MNFRVKLFLIFGLFLFLQKTKAQEPNENIDKILYAIYLSDYPTVDIDSVIQEQFKDTIQNIKTRISGSWHFQGIKKRYEDDFIDTLIRLSDGEATFVKNGEIIFLKNGVETKSNEILESYFNFEFDNIRYKDQVPKIQKGGFYEFKTCQPIYDIVYFQREIGLLSRGMLGNFFRPIKYLSNKILIIKTDKGLECYFKRE